MAVRTATPHFRLERVRALRERTEKLAKEELASSLAVQMRGEALLMAAARRVQDAGASRRRAAEDGELTGADLTAAHAYFERARLAREAVALDLDRQEADVDARRGLLTEASRDRRAIERLEDRWREERRVQLARVEGAELDEIAITAHRRRSAAR